MFAKNLYIFVPQSKMFLKQKSEKTKHKSHHVNYLLKGQP